MLSPKHVFTASVFGASENVRDSLSAGDLLAAWAARLLRDGCYSAREQQNLRNFTREIRKSAADRSGLGVIMELAGAAPIGAATYGVELLRAEIIGRGRYALPTPDRAHDDEEESNKIGNVAARRHRERRTRSTLYDLTDAMGVQSIASQIVSASEAADFRGR